MNRGFNFRRSKSKQELYSAWFRAWRRLATWSTICLLVNPNCSIRIKVQMYSHSRFAGWQPQQASSQRLKSNRDSWKSNSRLKEERCTVMSVVMVSGEERLAAASRVRLTGENDHAVSVSSGHPLGFASRLENDYLHQLDPPFFSVFASSSYLLSCISVVAQRCFNHPRSLSRACYRGTVLSCKH